MANIVRIFLSSSFQDMHAERDYLKKNAFAALRSELFDRGLSLQVMDLRGTTAEPGLSQEEAVLRLCLQGVDECVPRMVALIGDRYGWIPYGEGARHESEDDAARAALAVESISDSPGLNIERDEMAGRSVTHLEIYYGFKQMDRRHMLFYHRQGLPYEKMPPEWGEAFQTGSARQQALVQEIRTGMAEHPDNLKTYSATWDFEKNTVVGLEALNDMVYRDLKASLGEAMPQQEEETFWPSGDYFNEEAEATLEKDEEGYFVYPNYILELGGLCREGAHDFIYLQSEPGGGLTTAMAQLHHALGWWVEDGNLLLLPAALEYMGSRPVLRDALPHMADLVDDYLLRYADKEDVKWAEAGFNALMETTRVEEDEKNLGGYVRRDERYEEGLLALFFGMVERAARYARVVLLISGMELLCGQKNTLSWLAGMPRENVVVVFSAPDGALRPYMTPTRQWVPSMLDRDGGDEGYQRAAVMLKRFAQEYGKSFDAEILHRAALAVSRRGGTPLYARVLADFLMNMTGEDYLAYAGADAHLQYMRAQLDGLPGTTEGLYRLVADRALGEYGSLAKNALGLMVASRAPIPGPVFADALAQAEGREIADLELFSLRGYFNLHLARSRSEVFWGFAHRQMRRAVEGDYPEVERKRLAGYLYDALGRQLHSDEYAFREWLYLAWRAEAHRGLEQYMGCYDDHPRRRQGMMDFLEGEQENLELYGWLMKGFEVFDEDETSNLIVAMSYVSMMDPEGEQARVAWEQMVQAAVDKVQRVAEGIEDESVRRFVDNVCCSVEYRLLRGKWNTSGGEERRSLHQTLAQLMDRWEAALEPEDDMQQREIAGARLALLWAQVVADGKINMQACADFEKVLALLEGMGEDLRRDMSWNNSSNWMEYLVLLPQTVGTLNAWRLFGRRCMALLEEAAGHLKALEAADWAAGELTGLYNAQSNMLLLAREEDDDEVHRLLEEGMAWGKRALPHSYTSGRFIACYTQLMDSYELSSMMRGDDIGVYEAAMGRVVLLGERYNNDMLPAEEFFTPLVLRMYLQASKYARAAAPEAVDYWDDALEWFLDIADSTHNAPLMTAMMRAAYHGEYLHMRNDEMNAGDNPDCWAVIDHATEALYLALEEGGPLAEGGSLADMPQLYGPLMVDVLSALAWVVYLWLRDGVEPEEALYGADSLNKVLMDAMANYRQGVLDKMQRELPPELYVGEGLVHPVLYEEVMVQLRIARQLHDLVLERAPVEGEIYRSHLEALQQLDAKLEELDVLFAKASDRAALG